LSLVDYSWIDDVAPASHRASVTLSLAATYFDMDAANGVAAGIFTNTDPGTFISPAGDGRFETWGISGDMEAWLPANALHYFIGGLEGAWAESDRNQSSVVTTQESLSILPISGGALPPFSFSNLDPLEISSSSEFYRVAGVVGIGTDVAEGTKIGAGVYVGYSRLDVDAVHSSPSFVFLLNTIDESVKTWSAGLVVLGESRHEVTPGVGLFFKGRAAALYANGDLNADQMAFTNQFSANDRQETFAGLVDGQVGFEVAFGPNATISISAVRPGATTCSISSIRSPE
jgi:hypothetical protein